MRIGMTFNVRSESRVADLEGNTEQDRHEEGPHHSRYAQWADDDEEFDAPETVQALATVLESLGHEVDLLGEGEPMLRRLLGGDRPELVLNFAEGSGSGPFARSPRPGGAGDARHSLHRLRSVDAWR